MRFSALMLSLTLGTATAIGAAPPDKAPAPVNVVTTLPVYASIVSEIGGDQVSVLSIADPREDAHFVQPKPSFALELRRAQLFVTTGLDLELWVPPLIDKAGNARVSEGGPGYVTAYTGIKLLEVPISTDRSAGDIHVSGNPHIFTDPLNAVLIARNITTGLKRVAPDRAAVWDRGLAQFSDRIYRRLFGDRLVDVVGGEALANLARTGKLRGFLETTQHEGAPLSRQLGGWLGLTAPHHGARVVCYHKDWAYFEERFDIHCIDFVEAKPGIPPTPGHVAKLIETMKSQKIEILIAAEHFGRRKAEDVASRAGAKVVMVPMSPGTQPGVRTYFDLVDLWVRSISTALAS